MNHLWQSTLFVGAVWLVTMALRRNDARVQYWLWAAAPRDDWFGTAPEDTEQLVDQRDVRFVPGNGRLEDVDVADALDAP